MKLTDKTVGTLKLPIDEKTGKPKTDAIFFDDDVTGFGVRLRRDRNGKDCKPVWILQYRVGSKQRRMTIAKVGKVGAAAARKRAKELASMVGLGGDPQADRAKAEVERVKKGTAEKHTVAALVELYLEDKRKEVRPSTFRSAARYLRSHWKSLHRLQVDDVERVEIARLLRIISERSGDVAAARARSALQDFYAWAMHQGFSLRDASPVIGTKAPKRQEPRDRVLSAEEIADIWAACSHDDDLSRILQLLVLTACRRGEIGSLKWSEVDLEGAIIRLPAERVKNGIPYAIPLAPLAASIIEAIPKRAGHDHVFGLGPRGFQGWHEAKKALDARIAERRKKSGRPPIEEWHTHDVRRTAATGMADIGVEPWIIEQCLNHQSGHKRGPAGVYNRSRYEPQVKAAFARWAARVQEIVEGGERKVLSYARPGAA